MTLDEILDDALACGATDIILGGGEPPRYRLASKLVARGDVPLDDAQLTRMLYQLLKAWQIERLEADRQLDASLDRKGDFRFRLNLFYRRGGLAAVIRPISIRVPTPQDLGLPAGLLTLLEDGHGLILVTGRTGSGKSTMCASFIEYLNQKREAHIVTLEDPIEYVYEPKLCTISQRQVNEHTGSFESALKSVLRQSPDVIYVGEMRDKETIEATLSIAETGQLVLANLHTSSAAQTVHRMVDVFPAAQRSQISVQLANSLNAVICQILLPRLDGKGLVAAREVMISNTAICNLIRRGDLHQLYSAIETSGSSDMFTMDRSLAELVTTGVLDREVARGHAHDLDSFERLLASADRRATVSSGGW